MHQYYIRPLDDVNELEDFNCGVRAMDDFIHSKLHYSVANHYCTPEYSAVGFYDHCGFAPVEIKKAYKDTLRMFKTLYPLRFEHIDD